jgi:hypothetical protein
MLRFTTNNDGYSVAHDKNLGFTVKVNDVSKKEEKEVAIGRYYKTAESLVTESADSSDICTVIPDTDCILRFDDSGFLGSVDNAITVFSELLEKDALINSLPYSVKCIAGLVEMDSPMEDVYKNFGFDSMGKFTFFGGSKVCTCYFRKI